ncbi:bifunctional 4-hydroxy-2-oxoglutarate aldolase/2-dehydro-3-deoxy-phosphogluconate aldolase [uncultured Marinobacter sp.]|jgi:2-dehydro-3-deoxyphosphogluconate aldolase/(4S)-4-hydroxy-2-oxoglutarate aldolase|uniref:bifunctional 4-hydroxy-2-oxoglutarate aldolase/2-dehydro-3-deoxy-phosphogluconate aldolase n=1 Tax=uncultured Marinobacter sp. TaxID=187379 RepID=UPI00258A8F2A|nr:bifunctional 4-hydroxy-2-oxoglutarate aldolase/2-dehydro-3-deoxy-phosphogluconate aldolase [uncultured Marinobacter sp.]HLT12509.1 bifunctional 4-hydroxy-2-oxoglutarate aldolase/2-dehydro-3-deoxy-phosphogluconate aldolase [Marinobacter sp.]|tara:strand:- start:126 stop:773 length:648 start_codon:yes stop_codon:yes gene_type:complete
MNQLSDYHRDRVQAVLGASPLVPVIAIQNAEDALPLCRALVDGGIRVLEITLRTEHGVRAIEQIRKAIPEAWVGAGTVTSIAQYRQVESAGAQFVITPGVTEAILEFGVTSEAPLLPGISTVSELMMGYAFGYREFKFFPAEVSGGIPAIKAFSGPFPDVTFCPTGGINRKTAADYLALKNVKAVGGSWLTPADAIAAGRWGEITDIARASLADL